MLSTPGRKPFAPSVRLWVYSYGWPSDTVTKSACQSSQYHGTAFAAYEPSSRAAARKPLMKRIPILRFLDPKPVRRGNRSKRCATPQRLFGINALGQIRDGTKEVGPRGL